MEPRRVFARHLWLVALAFVACRSSAPSPRPVLHALRSEAPPGRAPVLIVLHGLGANEHDLFELGKQVAPASLVVALRAPLEVGPDQFSWFPVRFMPEGPVHDVAAAESSRARIVEFVRALKLEPGVDADRVTLLGFSQGAILSEAVAMTEPELVSAVVLMSGRTLPELKPAASTKRPRVLLLHGTKDPLLSYAGAVQSNQVLGSAGYDVDFRSFDARHEVTPEMVSATRSWLAADRP